MVNNVVPLQWNFPLTSHCDGQLIKHVNFARIRFAIPAISAIFMEPDPLCMRTCHSMCHRWDRFELVWCWRFFKGVHQPSLRFMDISSLLRFFEWFWGDFLWGCLIIPPIFKIKCVIITRQLLVSLGRTDQKDRVYQSPRIYFRWMYFVPWIHRSCKEHATCLELIWRWSIIVQNRRRPRCQSSNVATLEQIILKRSGISDCQVVTYDTIDKRIIIIIYIGI